MGILTAVGRQVARTGVPIKRSNIGGDHNALATSHAGTCRPGRARLYVKHDATLCVCVSKCFPWGAAGNPTDTEGSPDCRGTQETDTEPQAATFPGAILLYFLFLYYDVAPFTSHRLPTTVNSLRTLRYLRTANLFTRHPDR